MNQRRIITLSLLALPACLEFDAEVKLSNQTVRIPASFAGGCRGTGQSEDGSARWIKDDSSGKCTIRIFWSGDLVDLAAAKKDVPKELKDVQIVKLSAGVRDLRIEDASGRIATPEVEHFAAQVTVGENMFYDLDGRDLAAALGTTGYRVEFNDPDAILAAASKALDQGLPLRADAVVDITTATPDPLQAGNPHQIVFEADFLLEVVGGIL
jgi:hypothetical protein